MGESGASLKVLSIVGAGRSGTTVLASILGEVPGFASGGEIRWLWRRGVQERRPCACGLPPTQCPVWAPVVKQTLASVGVDDDSRALEAIVAAQSEVATTRHRPRILRSASDASDSGARTTWPALDRVRTAVGTACFSLAAATGSTVVIDSSKRPHDAAVLAAVPDISHYVLHVVRDPRAVAYSWRRAKSFTVSGQTHTMGTRRLGGSVNRWNANGWGAEFLRTRIPKDRWLRLRYEDFCADPRSACDAIIGLLGENGAPPFESPDVVRLSPGHLVAGNPSRFEVGAVQIRLDEEWRTGMSTRDQRLVSGATYPLRRWYGYTWG